MSAASLRTFNLSQKIIGKTYYVFFNSKQFMEIKNLRYFKKNFISFV